MTTTPRTLDSLAEAEAAECFRLAFRKEPISGFYWRSYLNVVTFRDATHELRMVFGKTDMSSIASRFDEITATTAPTYVRLHAVTRYLDSLGIQCGE